VWERLELRQLNPGQPSSEIQHRLYQKRADPVGEFFSEVGKPELGQDGFLQRGSVPVSNSLDEFANRIPP
jgi:hypothetical protein